MIGALAGFTLAAAETVYLAVAWRHFVRMAGDLGRFGGLALCILPGLGALGGVAAGTTVALIGWVAFRLRRESAAARAIRRGIYSWRPRRSRLPSSWQRSAERSGACSRTGPGGAGPSSPARSPRPRSR
ncbi:MAG TPA: hypothetical protein VGQ83_13680 [Polyangia bacterium]